MADTELIPVIDGFPRPDWQAIGDIVYSKPEKEWADEWMVWSGKWLDELLRCLPPAYRLKDSENFQLLSSQEDRYAELLLNFLEQARTRILASLEGIASDEGYGRHVVLMFDEQELYYRYKSYFYPNEGEFILSAGTYLNAGYGHFAFPFLEMASAEATSAHELTHACLSHLPMPLWLNEGFATTMEDEICGSLPLRMDNERLAEHAAFWDEKTIQDFWSGESFDTPGDASDLSYELARYCLRALAHDYEPFAAFANSALDADAGEAAAIEHFGGSLGGLIHQFFGDGDWVPNPETWSRPQ